MTQAKVFFAKKLDVMNEEFDTYLGALVADLIFKQHTLRSQVKSNLERVDNFANSELSQMLIEDLKRTDHLVHVENVMNLTEEELEKVRTGGDLDYSKVIQRKS